MKRIFRPLIVGVLLAAPLLTTGCAGRVGVGYYRAYDPYYHTYRPWNDNEVVIYNRWRTETHRDPHREFRHLNRGEQRQYWEWRRNHHHD